MTRSADAGPAAVARQARRLAVWRGPAALLRRAAGRGRTGRAGTGAATPLLSVVVPVHNDQERLDACLDSLLHQTLEELEVVVVDDGSTDHSSAILAERARRDPRLRVLTRRHRGPGEARNAGTAAARAPFLTFVDPEDSIPPAAYAYLVRTLQETGSDFAVGAVRGVKRGQSSRPSWVTEVHRVNRLHCTIEDFPDAMHDVIACNRVFRRDFWDRRVGPFPTGMAFEDHVAMVTAYVRAASFDLLSATTSTVHLREDPAAQWQQRHQLSNLEGRLAAKEVAWQLVADEAGPRVLAAWLGRLLDFDLALWVEFAVHADDAYRAVVQAAAQRFTARADADAWAHVRVDRKLRIALAAAGDWELADRSIEHFRRTGPVPETTVVDGQVRAVLPYADGLTVPPESLLLGSAQTGLTACLQTVRWRDDGRLEVAGWAYVQGVDLGDVTPELEACLLEPGSGRQLALTVEPVTSAAVTRWSTDLHQRYDRAGFRLFLPVAELAEETATRSTRWQLRLRVAARGVVREGAVHTLLRSGIAMRMRAGDLAGPDSSFRFVPQLDDRLGFVVQVRHERLQAVTLVSRGDAELAGSLRLRRPLGAQPTKVLARQGGKTVAKGRLHEQPDGTFTFALSLPVKGRGEHWDFRVLDADGDLHRVSWPHGADQGRAIGGYGPGTARWRRSPRGFAQISSRPVVLVATALSVTADSVVADVTLQGSDPGPLLGAELRSRVLSVPVHRVERLGGDAFRLVFPARAALWGQPAERPLPSGSYRLVVPLGAQRPAPVARPAASGRLRRPGPELVCGLTSTLMEQLPTELLTPSHGVTVARKPGADQLVLELRAPLAEDERGATAQLGLARWYAQTAFPPRDQVFFQCYRGEFSTDSQRAISEELHRRGAPLELAWGVHDLSVELPAGVRPVLMGSRAWYEAIAASRYLCNNNDFDRFFRRRSHQRFLQTFHGYPFKAMGVSHWRTRDMSPALIEEECTRRTDAWTSILLPASFCEELYRSEYLYEGEVLVTGYPRNDVLARALADGSDRAVRAAVLERLGVPAGKTVVLYAPTWRDTVATGDWSATYFDALELDRLADALGEDFVLLLRGHNFNMREGMRTGAHAQIVDVTRYPEITDLILAADAAVLDYSSLRFDWVLTSKVVLFFVPDLADYLSARTALFEYGPTAPGPLLSTTDDVLAALQDLESVSRDYAQARIDFNERFNALHDGQATHRVVDAFFGPAARPLEESAR